MTNTPTPEDIAEGKMMSEDAYRPSGIADRTWHQLAMLARQRREARGARVLPVFTRKEISTFLDDWTSDENTGDREGYLAEAINARIAASGFAQATTKAEIQARIDAAVLAEREACDFIAQWNEAPHVANLIRARATNSEIAGGLHPLQSSLSGAEGDKDRTLIKPGFSQPDPVHHERDEPMIATSPPSEPVTCGKCRFYVGPFGKNLAGYCHRFPDAKEYYPDHWCGEHKPKEAGR